MSSMVYWSHTIRFGALQSPDGRLYLHRPTQLQVRRAGEVRARVHTRRSQPVSLHVHYNQVHVQVHADADQMHATQSAVDLHTGVCSISRR